MAGMRSAPLPVALTLVLAASCAPSPRTLLVQLVSNLAPGREIDAVSVTVASGTLAEGSSEVPVPATASLGRPVRVASFPDLASGRHTITVTLRLGRTVVQERRIVRDVDGATVVTVLMTRDCNGVMCPGAGDPSAEACLGGRCVPPGCDEDHPELCPTPQCHADADCAGMGSTVACAPLRCSASGTCFTQPDDGLCTSGQLCDSALGCVAIGSDAGPATDAGHDAGADVGADAGGDAGADAGTSGCPFGERVVAGHCRAWLDFDGDGHGDLLVGASGESSSSGAAYLYRGTPSGPVLVGTFRTGNASEYVGLAVANVHDTNGDGRDDVLVSGHNFGPGHAYLIFGAATPPSTLVASVTLGASGSTEFGQFMAGVGDVNGDGLADAVIAEDGRAMVHLFRGRAGTGLPTTPDAETSAPDLFGVVAVGDLDRDGASDVALTGQLGVSEHVYLYYARAGAYAASAPDATLTSATATNFGPTTALDENGDGRGDLLVGYAGGATRFQMPPTGLMPVPVGSLGSASSTFGAALTTLGDADDDGNDDFAVADVGTPASVSVFLGRSGTGFSAQASIQLSLPPDASRTRVALSAGDVNADGVVDLVIGDPSRGHVYVLAGPFPASPVALTTPTYDLAPAGASGFGGAVAAH